MKIGVLTSSRADYGIYFSLISQLKRDDFFDLTIIAFGMHTSSIYGNTVEEVRKDGFLKIHEINSLVSADDACSIVTSYGLTLLKFGDYWDRYKYDLVFCIGDRFEMSAAVQAGIPFAVQFAHIHGGETTLGAIDNIYRHQITLASKLHFVSTAFYAEKIKEILGSEQGVFNVGSLSLDDVDNFQFLEEKDLRARYDFPIGDYVLTTFQPETINFSKNEQFANIVQEAISKLIDEVNFVISMPNADTQGSKFRKAIFNLKEKFPDKICVVETFGKKNYFSAMKYASLLLGNSSSGIIEAASFNKYAVNVGDRQKGRVTSDNIINCGFRLTEIISSTKEGLEKGVFIGSNIYKKSGASSEIINILKKIDETL
uniref:UDP-N-acetylglucosamine 2-epimerase n=1 Tax=Algoriphagus sp. TaxID=1872435 RepID=UPI0040477B58